MLETVEEFEVVGEAASGEEAVELAERLKPNIILMDINLSKMSGIEATKKDCSDYAGYWDSRFNDV